MAGAEQRHAQHAGLDQHDAAHVVLRDPILAPRHLAQFALVDRRRLVRGSRRSSQRSHTRIAGTETTNAV